MAQCKASARFPDPTTQCTHDEGHAGEHKFPHWGPEVTPPGDLTLRQTIALERCADALETLTEVFHDSDAPHSDLHYIVRALERLAKQGDRRG